MSTPQFDVAAAERWFAIQFNNAAWDLVEAVTRSSAETERMLHLAHAACLHWTAIGTPLNRLRAYVLLAFVYAEAGQASNAQNFADRAAAELPAIASPVSAFDQASIVAAKASGCRAAADLEGTARWLEQVREIAAGLTDADEARVVERMASRGRSASTG